MHDHPGFFLRQSVVRPPVSAQAAVQVEEAALISMQMRRNEIALDLSRVEAELAEITIQSICQRNDDTQDVELYDETLGPTKDFVTQCAPAIGQLHWANGLARRFAAPGELPGIVDNMAWGSGGLISKDLFLTAGHCFDPFAGPQLAGQNLHDLSDQRRSFWNRIERHLARCFVSAR